MGIRRQLEDTRSPAVKAARAQERSAATKKADRPEATPRAAAPAWAAECAVAEGECMAGAVVATLGADTVRGTPLEKCARLCTSS
jgi:hypothetical protein